MELTRSIDPPRRPRGDGVRMVHRVKIASPQEIVPLDRGKLRELVRSVLSGEDVADYEISLAFVDNPTIHRLNKQFLDHDEPTDVLTFPYTDPGAKKLEGEVVIGYEVATEYAADRGHELALELVLYVVHGCLHLCGYDDTTDAAAADMRAAERKYLAALGLPDIAGG